MPQFRIGYKYAIHNQCAADTGAQGRCDHKSLYPSGRAKPGFRKAGSIGIIHNMAFPAGTLAHKLIDIYTDP